MAPSSPGALARAESVHDVTTWSSQRRKARYGFAGVLFAGLMARVLYLHNHTHQLWEELVNNYENDSRKDSVLSSKDMLRYLQANGIDIDSEQFHEWVSDIDNEHNGFDEEEVMEVMDAFDEFDTASMSVTSMGAAPWRMAAKLGDVTLVLGTASFFIYMLWNQDKVEENMRSNRFVSALKVRTMQSKWRRLERQAQDYEASTKRLQSEEQKLVDDFQSKQSQMDAVDEELKLLRHRSRGNSEELLEREARRQELLEQARLAEESLAAHREKIRSGAELTSTVQRELSTLQRDMQNHVSQAHMSCSKLQAMHVCLKGINDVGSLNPFKGAATGRFNDHGATPGFAVQGSMSSPAAPRAQVSSGFRVQSFVFGYPTEKDFNFFEVDKSKDLLGEGADCAYKATEIATGKKFAVKIYDIGESRHKRQIMNDLHAKQAVKKCPLIVKYEKAVETESQIFVLMELINGIDLFSDVIARQGFTEPRAAIVFRQLAQALDFCHGESIIHGDVKPENAMVLKDDQLETAPNVKLIDFGFSSFHPKDGEDCHGHNGHGHAPSAAEHSCAPGADERHLPARFVVDPYMVPEAMDQGAVPTPAVDSFRLGCLLYVLLVATYPFDVNGRDVQARRDGKVKQYARYKNLSADAKNLIEQLLKDRISMKDALQHPWLAKHAPMS